MKKRFVISNRSPGFTQTQVDTLVDLPAAFGYSTAASLRRVQEQMQPGDRLVAYHIAVEAFIDREVPGGE